MNKDKIIYIKSMVCSRCISSVEDMLRKLSISFDKIELGEVHLNEPIDENSKKIFDELLKQKGFELLNDIKAKTISKIKSVIIETIHYGKEKSKRLNYSDYLASKLGKDYGTLSRLFSEVEGVTIENYIIKQRVERVKELLKYNELTLSEIAIDMNYSSVSHLSLQFKKVIGLTPSAFKNLHVKKRKSLDEI